MNEKKMIMLSQIPSLEQTVDEIEMNEQDQKYQQLNSMQTSNDKITTVTFNEQDEKGKYSL